MPPKSCVKKTGIDKDSVFDQDCEVGAMKTEATKKVKKVKKVDKVKKGVTKEKKTAKVEVEKAINSISGIPSSSLKDALVEAAKFACLRDN